MEKTYDPAAIEARISKAWEAADAFAAGRGARDNAQPFCIVIPPPNVTGSLHMGHALNNTLQDILIRFERMRGKDVLWQPGTDHAGIATQMVVERKLAQEQKPGRRDMGREKFLEEVWAWKEESGGTIINQLKRLGASCDWSRERFTMDPGLSDAVIEFFVGLHEAGLMYKDKRLVNWDPKLLTAISDLEVEQKEIKGSFKWNRDDRDADGNPAPVNHAALGKLLDKEPGGHLYYFDYPVVDAAGKETGAIVTVATTRPETMLGDTAVAVHPTDERYAALVGMHVRLPLVGRLIPIVADEYSDPEKGTGAVKITPAHDFNDFEVGKRAGVAAINVMTAEGKMDLARNKEFMADNAPQAEVIALDGADRFAARKAIITMMEAAGLLQKIEPTVQQVPHGDRSGVPIEPFLTDQWYVNVKPLAEQSMAAVKSGETRITPANREADFFRWMENIEPWCVSRQLWWGHQIPAWYGPKIEVDGQGRETILSEQRTHFVARNAEEALGKAREAYAVLGLDSLDIRLVDSEADAKAFEQGGGRVGLYRDPDVLDTWFSSALWPFSTLGWPGDTPDLEKYYPNSVLITGFDILFFWVARMMMAGIFTQGGRAPFADVYLHGLVRDERGQKMSKSKGNVIDPLVVIDQLGADALRFTLASLAAQGRDPKLGVKTAEGYRNFCTKIWNASRFAEMNGCARVAGFDPAGVTTTLNRWIVGETQKAVAGVMENILAYRFNDAAGTAYRFVWNTFCDWYLELAKPTLFLGKNFDDIYKAYKGNSSNILEVYLAERATISALNSEDFWNEGLNRAKSLGGEEAAAVVTDTAKHIKKMGLDKALAEIYETRATTAWALDQIVTLLHPFMPFITEELWAAYGERAGTGNATLLALSPWPELAGLENAEAEAEIGWIVDLVTEIRSARAEMNVPAAGQIPLSIVAPSLDVRDRALRQADVLKRLARLSDITFADTAPPQSVQVLVRGTTAALPLAGVIDIGAEKHRLSKELEKIAQDISRIDAKLGNADFVARAPEEVIDEQRERRADATLRQGKVAEALSRLA